MSAMEIIQAVVDGKLDDELEAIISAAKDRRTHRAQAVKYTLRSGDRVRVVGSLRPRYLVGLVGIVKRVNDKTVSLDFEDPMQARRYRHGVRMPLENVEKV